MDLFINTYLRMFVLLAPFFAVSMFLKMSEGMKQSERRRAACRCGIAVLVAIFICYFFGRPLFSIMGITLASFQIGAGTTLFVSSMLMILSNGKKEAVQEKTPKHEDDFAVVPLALPIIVGPGTIGALMVWGTEQSGWVDRSTTCIAMLLAATTIFIFLLLAERIQRLIGQKLLAIMTKVTALILTAIAVQIIFSGVRSMLADGAVV